MARGTPVRLETNYGLVVKGTLLPATNKDSVVFVQTKLGAKVEVMAFYPDNIRSIRRITRISK